MKVNHERRWTTWAAGLAPVLLSGLLAGCGGGGDGVSGGGQPLPLTHPVSVTVSGGGKVTSVSGIDCGSTCSTNIPVNTSITLVAVPNAGQQLQSWGGACAEAIGNTCSLTLTQAKTASATFVAQPSSFELSVTVAGSGSVRSQPAGIDCASTCSAPFAESTVLVLTALPSPGQTFQSWGGACEGSNTCTLNMSQARSVTAAFGPATGPLPAWGLAAQLENSDDFNVTESGVVHQVNAIAANGDAMVIWQQPDGQPNGSVSKVYSRLYIAGQGWQPAVQVPGLSDFANRQLVGGRLFLDNQGVATWIRPGLDSRRFTATSGWSTAFNPPAAPSGAGQFSSAVMDETGNIRALTNGNDVYSLTLPAGGSWRDWVRVDASGSLNTDAAVMARSSNGSSMAVWVERNPGDANDSIKAARFDPAGGWQAPVTIDNSFDDVDQSSPPSVAMDAAGNAMAVWEQGGAIQVARFTPGAGWATPVGFDAGALSTQDLRIRVAMAANGRAVVAWQSGLFAIKTVRFTPGEGFSAAVVATPYALDRALGIDEQGNAQLVYVAVDQWPDPTSPEISVYARRWPWGQAWEPPVLLESRPGGIKAGLAVAFTSDGRAIASWAQNDTVSGERNSLWANVRR